MGKKKSLFAMDIKKGYVQLPTRGLTTRARSLSYCVVKNLGNKYIPLWKDKGAQFFIVKNLTVSL